MKWSEIKQQKEPKRRVHIVGTGTIGEPLIGLLTRHKEDFGIHEVTFHKNQALAHDMSKVKQLVSQGAVLSTDQKTFSAFEDFGVEPKYTREEAIERASVVIDCTPQGIGTQNKKDFYEKFQDGTKLFLAQGSEKGFGKPYARGINEEALTKDDKFVQVVSCNTHNIAVLLKLFAGSYKILDSHFVCIRRSNDVSQDGGMTPGIEVGTHVDRKHGTHHGVDVGDLFRTMKQSVPVFTSACKVNSQYMHAIHFNIKIEGKEDPGSYYLMNMADNYKKISTTRKKTSNKVFSFGRDYGHYGRLLTQTVISLPTVEVRDLGHDKYEVIGFTFTPQDGNSLISSTAATLWALHDHDWGMVDKLMDVLRPYLFQEV